MLSQEHAKQILLLADALADTAAVNYADLHDGDTQGAEDDAQRELTDFVLSLVVEFADA